MGRLAQWLERLLHTQEVTGSSPVSPTIEEKTPVLTDDLSLRELLEMLLTPEVKRKLRLRNLNGDELFLLYDSDLKLKIHNPRNLDNERRLLLKFRQYLNNFPPSPELAKGFLAQYTDRKPRTLIRYASTIKSFMQWYGEPMNGFKIRSPKTLPQYINDSDIDRLFGALENKVTHRDCIARDSLLVELALKTGMRRAELANLQVKDIEAEFLIVVAGKGLKDRHIPLIPVIAERLHNFTKGKRPDDRVFDLRPASISNKIQRFAKKAGLDIHCHSLRHKFATSLVERGASIKAVQELLGHQNLGSTQVYLAIRDQELRDAVNLLDDKPDIPEGYEMVTVRQIATGIGDYPCQLLVKYDNKA